ncbi:MAG TPA: exonuclease sbcCD subunit D [Eubacteriaceae bacterium]|nr:exonuclease sbcCD subunit D [Eubacteriaceae bacterium]
MKLLHLADLHIGKKVNGFSMIEDQQEILRQVCNIIDEKKTDGVLIAGDVYDKAIPPAEGVALFDWFLTELSKRKQKIFIVSGNHDSSERISFASGIMKEEGVYISKPFHGELERIVVEDPESKVHIYLLPFIRPAHVKAYFPEAEIEDYTDAVDTVIKNTSLDPQAVNILMAHQFVVNRGQLPMQSDSESISVGSLDHVEASCFAPFDYVALGHLHHPQKVGRKSIRYAGSPLKYSFSEAGKGKKKSVPLLTIDENGVDCETISLDPIRDLRIIRGPIDHLLSEEVHQNEGLDDYMLVVLTDEDEPVDPLGKIRSVYPNTMKIEFDNKRSKQNQSEKTAKEVAKKSSYELFEEFYFAMNNVAMSEEEKSFVQKILEEVEEKA